MRNDPSLQDCCCGLMDLRVGTRPWSHHVCRGQLDTRRFNHLDDHSDCRVVNLDIEVLLNEILNHNFRKNVRTVRLSGRLKSLDRLH